MDPILVAALREYLKQADTLRAQGIEISPEHAEEFFRASTENKYGWGDAQEKLGSIDTHAGNPRNVIRSIVQGATSNFGDEILDLFGLDGNEMRLRDDLYKKAHPKVRAGLEVGGALALPGIPVARALGRAPGVLRAAGTGAAVGGLFGAAAGAGAAEGGVGDRLAAAAPAAAGGAVAGGLLPGAVGAFRSAFSPAARSGARLDRAVARSDGVGALIQRAEEYAAANRERLPMLGDLSRPLQQATDFAANNSDEAAEAIGRVAYPRQAGQAGRIVGDVADAAGDPHADQIVDNMAEETRRFADGPEGYGGLREKNPVIVPAMAESYRRIMGSKAVQQAWQQAREVGLIGPLPKSGSVSFDVMQGTLERLATAREKAFNSGTHDLAFRLKTAHDALEAEMRTAIPNYGRVAAEYATRKEGERLVREGEEWFQRADSRGLQDRLAGLEPKQLELFRQGMTSRLLGQLRAAKTNKQVAREMIQRSAATEEKLNVVFGGPEEFQTFVRRMELEDEMSQALAALSGSATHRRQAAAGDGAEIAVDALTGNPVGAITGAIRRLGSKVVGESTARRMAPALTTQGTEPIRRLLETWNQRPPLVNPYVRGMVPTGMGTAAGLFSDE